MAAQHHVGLAQRQALAGRHAQHQFDDVDAGDLLRHRVLDLQPRVDFEEPVTVARHEELDRADAAVVQALRQPHRVGQQLFAQAGRQRRRGCFLDQLLVPALQRALAFEEVDDVAAPVAGDLHFDVPAALDVGLDDQRRVAEGAAGFAHRGADGLDQRIRMPHHVHALAATAGRGLQQHRQRQRACPRGHHLDVGTGLLAAIEHRHAGRARLGLRGGLVAQTFDDLGRRADEDQPGSLHRAGKRGILGQEAVARMDGLRAAAQRGGDHGIDAQVALGGAGAAQADRLADLGRVQRVAVGTGVHAGHRDAEAPAGAGDAAGDLAAVGNQNLLKQACLPRRDRLRTLRVPGNVASPLRRLASAGRRGWQSESS